MRKQIIRLKWWLTLCLGIVIGMRAVSLMAIPVAEEPVQARHEEQFKKDYGIKGLFSETQETFYIEDWEIEACWLALNYSITPLVDEYLSDLTIAINGTRFHAERLKYHNKSKQQLKVSIPKEYLKEGINTITVESYIRTEEGLPCVDDVSTANWMNIYKESKIGVKYTPHGQVQSIADLYDKITSIYSLEHNKSLVAIPRNPSDGVLTGAMNLLAGLAPRAVMKYDELNFETISTLEEIGDREFVMYLSTVTELPPQFRSLLEAKELEKAREACLMKLIHLPGDKSILLIVGQESELLKKAGRLMGNPEMMRQLKGIEKWITGSDDIDTIADKEFQYYELTKQGNYVKGPFRRSTEFYIDLPKNRLLADSSQIYLKIRYSENLDFDRSLVTVYINDYPVGSKKLSLANANEDEVILDIPMDIQIAGGATIKVAFDLEIKDLWCTLRQGETPWAFVSNESMIKLNTIQNPFLSFEYYPAPFVNDYRFNQVNIIVPNEMSEGEYKALGSVALTMGRFVRDNRGSLKVTRVSNVGDVSKENLIVMGTFQSNQMIQDLNEHLYFKFDEEGQTVLSNDKQILEPEYSKTLGVVQLVKSSYAEGQNAVAVMSGVNQQGMLEAVSYLGSLEGLWHLYGEVYVANQEEIKSYRFEDVVKDELTFKEKINQRKDLIPLSISVVMIGVLLILMSILLINKYYKGGRQ